MIISAHKDFNIYIDTKTGKVQIELVGEEPYLIELQADALYKIKKVIKESGETNKDVAKKKPEKVLIKSYK